MLVVIRKNMHFMVINRMMMINQVVILVAQLVKHLIILKGKKMYPQQIKQLQLCLKKNLAVKCQVLIKLKLFKSNIGNRTKCQFVMKI